MLDIDLRKQLEKIANTIRELSMEAVEKANSGHPGLPMGCAEFGAFLYGCLLRHNPKNRGWFNRDRFVLSAGHGSMLLYSCLHLAGFPVSMEDIRQFRQLHSKTPGHPELHMTEGVEATTGPLGQGVGNATGMALALKILAEKFNRDGYPLFDAKVYCLAGDGCMMEGVSSEASALAGHLRLDNLILIYDANHVTLDGPLADCGSENTMMRYRAYGWDTYELDGYDFDAMDALFSQLRQHQTRPALVFMSTIIGKGSPNKAGTHKVHGSPLGPEELALTKKALDLPQENFYVPQSVTTFFEKKRTKDAQLEEQWQQMVQAYAKAYPAPWAEFVRMRDQVLPDDLETTLRTLTVKAPQATRASAQTVIQKLGDLLPQLYGGSADLSGSDCTLMKQFTLIAPGKFSGRNIKYGVREFGMATIATGMCETGMIRPFIGTFLTFSDYMRNAIRLAALSRVPVIYQFTHDSIFLGEDGPTHQPIEHLAALRAIPNLHLIRPADTREVKMAWLAALRYKGPTALVLSRQSLPDLPGTDLPYADGVGRGAYIVQAAPSPQFTFFATGSELSLAFDVATALERQGKAVRIVSVPSWELFEKQPADYKASILGGSLGRRVSIEAATTFGWSRFLGFDGIAIGLESFGASAPASALAHEFGFTVDAILARIL